MTASTIARQGTIRRAMPARVVVSEATIQRSIVSYLNAVVPGAVVWAVPNSALRTRTGRASNAVPGLRKGVFDLSLILPDGRFAAIEVKNARGKLSPEQEGFRDLLMAKRVPYCVARGVDDVREFLKTFGVETREAQS